jgi:hypothetical protein
MSDRQPIPPLVGDEASSFETRLGFKAVFRWTRMTLPNLVIAGAPKCGTSSLFDWLVAHPEVCGSSVKEPFFLIDEGNPLQNPGCNFHDHGLDAYASFFEDCSGHEKVIVEATTHYIYQQTALAVLSSLPGGPRVIFVLRKPSDRVFSSFAFSKNNLGNVRSDLAFADFVRRVTTDPDDPALKTALGPSAYVLTRDIQYSRYVDYLLKWRERLGEDGMRIILFESMRSDPKRVMEELSDWLVIDASFYAEFDFTARNRTVSVRSGRIQRMARALAANMPAGRLKGWFKGVYGAVQSKRAEGPTPEDEAALAELDDHFRASNDRLAKEFGLNLDAWA